MRLDQNWFTEASEKDGCAFSLKYSKKLHEEQSAFQKIEVYRNHKLRHVNGHRRLCHAHST